MTGSAVAPAVTTCWAGASSSSSSRMTKPDSSVSSALAATAGTTPSSASSSASTGSTTTSSSSATGASSGSASSVPSPSTTTPAADVAALLAAVFFTAVFFATGLAAALATPALVAAFLVVVFLAAVFVAVVAVVVRVADFVAAAVLVRAVATVPPLVPVRVFFVVLAWGASTTISMSWASSVVRTGFICFRSRPASTWARAISVPVMVPLVLPLTRSCMIASCWNTFGRVFGAPAVVALGTDAVAFRRRPRRLINRFRACIITTKKNGVWCRKGVACRSRSLSRALGAPGAIRYSDIIKRHTPSERTDAEPAHGADRLTRRGGPAGWRSPTRHSPLTASTGQLASRRIRWALDRG